MPAYWEDAAMDWTPDSVRLIATPSQLARTSLYYVQEIGHFRTLPTYYTEREHLDSYLIVYTLSGEGRLMYRGKTHGLKPGRVFFIHCMEFQRYETAGDGWELLWVHLNGASVRAYYELFDAGGSPAIDLPPDARLAPALRELLELHRQRGQRTELLASRRLTDVLTELVLAARTHEMPPVSERPAHIADMAQLLERDYRSRWTLDRLSERFAVSKYHLAKEFKRFTGFSPGEYAINVRVTRAKELLKYTDRTVAEIAADVGIEHVTHFINLFKHRTGLTPLAFRRGWRR